MTVFSFLLQRWNLLKFSDVSGDLSLDSVMEKHKEHLLEGTNVVLKPEDQTESASEEVKCDVMQTWSIQSKS